MKTEDFKTSAIMMVSFGGGGGGEAFILNERPQYVLIVSLQLYIHAIFSSLYQPHFADAVLQTHESFMTKSRTNSKQAPPARSVPKTHLEELLSMKCRLGTTLMVSGSIKSHCSYEKPCCFSQGFTLLYNNIFILT